MSGKNSTVEGTIEEVTVTEEQAEKAFAGLDVVNIDEVTLEVIPVKVKHYKLVDITDESGEPICDEQGKPLQARRALIRTAHLTNHVPTPMYHKVMARQKEMSSANF